MRLTFYQSPGVGISDLHHHRIVPRVNGDDETHLILRVQCRLEGLS